MSRTNPRCHVTDDVEPHGGGSLCQRCRQPQWETFAINTHFIASLSIREFDKNQNKKQILSHSSKGFIFFLLDFLFKEFHSRMLATELRWASLRAASGLL